MSIAKRFLHSSAYMMLGTGANSIVAFLVFVILARLLDPGTIGLVFFALIFIELGRVLVFGGLPEAVIQREEWTQEAASTCFFVNMALACLVVAVAVGLIGPVLQVHFHPQAWLVISALAATLPIDGARAIHEAKLRRDFNYRMLAARGAISTMIAGALAVAMAYSGYGLWALVAHRVVASILLTALTWGAARWRPSLTFSRSVLNEIWPFTAHLIPARFLMIFNMKIAELVVGVVLGPAAAGLYRVGGRALEAIGQTLLQPMRDAALSAFSRLPDPAAVGAAYVRATRIMALIACPIYLGAAALAPDIVVLLFGAQWASSGWIMAALALGVGGHIFSYFLQSALTATAQTSLVLRTSLVGTVLTGGLCLAAVPFGALAVAVAVSLRSHLAAPFWLFLLSGKTKLDWRQAVRAVLPFWLAGVAMAAAVTALRLYAWPDAALIVRIGAGVAAGAAVYAGLLLIFGRHHLRVAYRELMPLMPKRLRRFLPTAD